MTNAENAHPIRSTFVTVIAWIFIVVAGFATLIAFLQNAMLNVMFSGDMPALPADGSEPLPPFAKFLFENFRLIFAAFFLLSATTLITAIGLLNRLNWARVVFIGLMGLGIVWNLGSIAFTFLGFPDMPFPESAPAEFRAQHEQMMAIMNAATTAIALAFTAVFAWIIKRLMSEAVRREFLAR